MRIKPLHLHSQNGDSDWKGVIKIFESLEATKHIIEKYM